jgi:hypothetical protein
MKYRDKAGRVKAACIAIMAFGTLLTLPISTYVYADNINAALFPPDSKQYGLTYAEWTAKWWQWIFSVPQQDNPLTDSTGKNCAQKQSGSVWFLAGTTGGKAERTCVIPSGSAILAPIMNAECSFLEFPSVKTLPDLITCAKADNDRTINLKAVVDGQQLKNLENYRMLSPLFKITIPPDNVLGAPAGNTQMISDGWWIFLKPLPTGQHTVQFSGLTPGNPTTGTNNFAVDITYHIIVK